MAIDKKLKVLVIEDDKTYHCLLLYIERAGAEFDYMLRWQSGVFKVPSKNYDLVFMDMHLRDGWNYAGGDATKKGHNRPPIVITYEKMNRSRRNTHLLMSYNGSELLLKQKTWGTGIRTPTN